MKLRPFAVDYRRLRLNNLCSPEFRHLLWLLYWPCYLLAFLMVERLFPAAEYHTVHCALDDLIPFCEWFFIPYAAWYVGLLWASLYTLAYDVDAFRHFMQYLVLTTGATVIIYVIWPTQQLMRPDLSTLGRDNLLTRIVGLIYAVDTNTNVCPSLHCIGAFAVMFAALDVPRFRTRGWTVFFVVFALLICVSTVFMKQHSALDFLCAIPLIVIGWLIVYLPGLKKRKQT